MRYANYHKHDVAGIQVFRDSRATQAEYVKRALELGHKSYFTTNHGCGGDIFEARDLCDQAGLKCIFGLEAYIVPDASIKDRRNYHIIIIPRTNEARFDVNERNSDAHETGYFYRPRWSVKDLLSLNPDEVYITTACVAGIIRDDDAVEQIFKPLFHHFGKSLFLEVQDHDKDIQKNINRKAIAFSEKYGLGLIHANDSHYIFPEDAEARKIYMYNDDEEKRKKKKQDAENDDTALEEDFILDYPDSDTIFARYRKQGVLTEEQVKQALENTLIMETCEPINIDKEVKIPLFDPTKSNQWQLEELGRHINSRFEEIASKEGLTQEEKAERRKAIDYEYKIIADTNELRTASYFLTDEKIVSDAINKYGGVLTPTGRGSSVSFYINHVLGLTQIDRLKFDLPIFPERFMSTARILENHSLPDFDMNIKDQEPFVQASRDLMGENGCYKMIAYDTYQLSGAFRLVCKSKKLEFSEYNKIAKNIESHMNDKKWKPYIQQTESLIDIYSSVSPHPCSHLLLDKNIRREIGVIRTRSKDSEKVEYCVPMTSAEADAWKYLKNDYLIVTVLGIISDSFKEVGREIMSVDDLIAQCNEPVWNLYKDGKTVVLNQVESAWATGLVRDYAPKNLRELAMFCACLRPSFNSWRDKFISRESYSTGSSYMDDVLRVTDHYILFQENLMQYFNWLGISPAESIGLIKKISKKKIKQEDFDDLEANLKRVWIEKTGSEDLFAENWSLIQSCIEYGFNTPHAVCVACDSLYGAWLKYNYPLQFYTVSLNYNMDDTDKVAAIMEEAATYKIKIITPKFGHSQSTCSYDVENNRIYQGLPSIKGLSAKINTFLHLMGSLEPTTFTDTLWSIPLIASDEQENIAKPNKTQLETLIKLDFFSAFGKIQDLLAIKELWESLGTKESRRTLKIAEIRNPLLLDIIKSRMDITGKNSVALTVDDRREILRTFESRIGELSLPDIPWFEQVRFQQKHMGRAYVTGREEDRSRIIVGKLRELKSGKTGNVCGIAFDGTSVGSGKISNYVIWNSTLNKQEKINSDSVIQVLSTPRRTGRGSWEIREYKVY